MAKLHVPGSACVKVVVVVEADVVIPETDMRETGIMMRGDLIMTGDHLPATMTEVN